MNLNNSLVFYEDHSMNSLVPFSAGVQKRNTGFPVRIHRPFECFAVKLGKVTAVINDKNYELSAGEAVLVFPYQKHKYEVETYSEVWVCTFSPDLVKSFSNWQTNLPLSYKFKFQAPEQTKYDSLFAKKAICYYILSVFDKSATYIDNKYETNDLIVKIFEYIAANYLDECKLKDVSLHVGYDCDYISKFFKKMVGQSFKSYINTLRISEACRLLRETDMDIQTISEKCGFGTVRNFNIAFLNLTKKTPKEYRKK